MAGITPLPTTRVSDLLARTRLTQQLQRDQLALFRIQDQISSGRRISVPSDDASASVRAISLQRLLERKEQIQTNLATNQSFLAASDNALNSVSGLLADIRGSALGVAGTTNTEEQRRAVAEQVDRAIRQLVDVGNQQFRGRYLFAGSRSGDEPFSLDGEFVEYRGNERDLRSYSDLDVLFETNVNGDAVFGAISDPVLGAQDLNPHLTADTLLSSLRGGRGVSPNGAVTVSDGVQSIIVDLSNASTIGDVAALLEANPPEGRSVSVEITSHGLSISLDAAGGGNLSVTEVTGGTTAKELGIFEKGGVLTGPLVGGDLNPVLRPTTPIGDLLGSKSKATFDIPGANNNLRIESAINGGEFNVDISFAAGGVAGSEVVTFTPGAPGSLVIQIEEGVSTAEQVAAAISAEGTFHAQVDPRDALTPEQAGTGVVALSATTTTFGGSGSVLDESGIQIANKRETYVIDFAVIETVGDLLNQVNGSGAGVLAEINAEGNGINIRSRISGVDFSIGENGGTSASQLGLRSLTSSTRLEQLNRGIGVPTVPGTDFTIVSNDGTELDVDVSSAETIDDVLNLINGHPLNGGRVEARLAEHGNGIELVDAGPVAPNSLRVRVENLSQAAEYLGLVAKGESEAGATTTGGDPEILTGGDPNPQFTDGVFNTLARLKEALVAGDIERIESAIAEIESDIDRVNFTRSEVGARQQSLDVLKTRLEDEEVELKSALSLEIDTDLTEAISNLTSRQISLQASLQTAANLLQLTILDFI